MAITALPSSDTSLAVPVSAVASGAVGAVHGRTLPLLTASDARQALAPVARAYLCGRCILSAVIASCAVATTLVLATFLLSLHQLKILLSDVIGQGKCLYGKWSAGDR